MSSFVKNQLSLVAQSIGGNNSKIWTYWDTGAIADVTDVAGYFAQAGDMGMDSGDLIFIRANNGYTNHLVWGGSAGIVQDTGASQAGTGPAITVGDTG